MNRIDTEKYSKFINENYGSLTELKNFCEILPKIELHAHLNGSISPETLDELIKQRNDPKLNGFTVKGFIQPSFKLEDFFPLFNVVYQLTDNLKTIKYITENVIKEFSQDGVRYLELRSTPRNNIEKGMTKESYVDTVLSAVENIKENIIVKVILSIDRKSTLEEAMETVNIAISMKHRNIVGVDMCGNTNGGAFKRILPAFNHAKKNGLCVTLHVAEIPNCREDNLDMVSVSPDRMGHCTYLEEDLLKWARENKVAIESCITSNIICRTVESYEEHPVKEYLKTNQPFVICTDDKGVFQCDLSDEYMIFAAVNGLNKRQLFEISKKMLDYIMCKDQALQLQLQRQWNEFEKNELNLCN